MAGGTGDVAFRVLDAMHSAQYGSSTAQYGGSFASGSGGAAPAAAAAAEELPGVTVCDINASMLAEGRKKAEARGLGPESVQWVEGNAEALPFESDTFDSYTIAFGIRNVTDRAAALREAHRCDKSSGRAWWLCCGGGALVATRRSSPPRPLRPSCPAACCAQAAASCASNSQRLVAVAVAVTALGRAQRTLPCLLSRAPGRRTDAGPASWPLASPCRRWWCQACSSCTISTPSMLSRRSGGELGRLWG